MLKKSMKLIVALFTISLISCTGQRELEGELYWARVKDIELVSRYGGDKAFIHWQAKRLGGYIDFMQEINISDTSGYYVGYEMRVMDIR